MAPRSRASRLLHALVPLSLLVSITAASPLNESAKRDLLLEWEQDIARTTKPSQDALADAIILAKARTFHQAQAFGENPFSVALQIPWHDSPHQALRALALQHGTSLREDEALALDALREPLRSALTQLVNAFLVFDAQTRSFRGSSDAANVISVFPPRSALLDATLEFRNAASAMATGDVGVTCVPVELIPVFAIDIEGCDTIYLRDVAFLLDVGGNDVYFNNAGGNGRSTSLPCEVPVTDTLASALIDLGSGHDTYGTWLNYGPFKPRICGANGGGAGGAGFLLDEAGNDAYFAGQGGTNGGGNYGAGFLLDAGGNDTYQASSFGVNGGAVGGTGFLLDVEGNDRYLAVSNGVNGAGEFIGPTTVLPTGIGLLLDTSGHDTYFDHEGGTGADRTVLPKKFGGAQLDLLARRSDVHSQSTVSVLVPSKGCVHLQTGRTCTPGSPLPVNQVSTGTYHTCVRLQGIGVDCYGFARNDLDDDYALPDGIEVPDIASLDAGDNHNCVLLSSGNVECWGSNAYGESSSYTGGNAVQVTAGSSHTCILTWSGNADCRGFNLWGQAADYNLGDALQVTAGGGWTCILNTSKNVRCWGLNFNGQANPYTGGDAVAVDAGGEHTCALKTNGDVFCWGANFESQADSYNGGDAIAVSAGGYHTCALVSGGNVHCWGSNVFDQSADYLGGDAIAVSAGGYHTCVLLVDKTAICWGSNSDREADDYP